MRVARLLPFDETMAAASLAAGLEQFAAAPQGEPPAAAPVAPVSSPLTELAEMVEGLVPQADLARLLAGPGEAPQEAAAPLPIRPAAPEPGESLPAYEIEPLAPAAPGPLSLQDKDLFGGAAEVAPLAPDTAGPAALFQGFQVDLFGAGGAPGDGLEVSVDAGIGLPKVETGRVTMFDGPSEFEVSSDLAAGLVGADGRLLIEGDGDDLVSVPAGWSPVIGLGPDAPAGFAYFYDAESGVTVGVRGAEVLLV